MLNMPYKYKVIVLKNIYCYRREEEKVNGSGHNMLQSNTTIPQTVASRRISSSLLWQPKQMYLTITTFNWESLSSISFQLFPNLNHCYLPISGFFASSASSVVKRVFGKRMKIFDLQTADKTCDNFQCVHVFYTCLIFNCDITHCHCPHSQTLHHLPSLYSSGL